MDAFLPDMWKRMARLDQRCQIVTMSHVVGGSRRVWIVRVYRRSEDKPPMLEMRGRSLVEPLTAAILAAERSDN